MLPIASYLSISRSVLNSMPYWLLLPLVTIACVGVAVLALYLIRRLLDQWRSSADAGVIGGVAAMVLTLFALLLAFGIVTLYDERQDAKRAVAQEASDLAEVRRDVKVLEEKKTTRVEPPIKRYVCHVIRDDFKAMRNGEPVGSTSSNDLADIFMALKSYTPTDASQTAFYVSAVSELSDAVSQRRQRIAGADNALPFAFGLLLILTAVICVLLTCFIKTSGLSRLGEPHGGVEYLLVGCVAFVVAAGLLTALIFEFPFSGPLAISGHAYTTVSGC